MLKRETCGNEYDKAFTVTMDSQSFAFESFECAIERFAPVCARCRCRFIGHGVEAADEVHCRAHCAAHAREKSLRERSP